MQLNINHINKTDFLAAYYEACIKIFKSENIHNIFTATELISYRFNQNLLLYI